MFKLFFLYLLLIHILGDFYFQSRRLAREKKESSRKLLLHSAIYAAVSIAVIIPVFRFDLLLAAIFLSLSHLAIDFCKYIYIRDLIMRNAYPAEKERSVYLADQLMHIACIAVIAYALTSHNSELLLLPSMDKVFITADLSFFTLFYFSLILLLIWKPANITIKHLLCSNKPWEEDGKKAGGLIGLLERLIILLFLFLNQFAAIGLVLTAKSIARYDEISKNKDFAEYYLLGTLLSTFIVISVFLFVT